MTGHEFEAPVHVAGQTYTFAPAEDSANFSSDEIAQWQKEPTLQPFVGVERTPTAFDAAEIANHPFVEMILDKDGVPDTSSFMRIVDDHRYGRSDTLPIVADVIKRADDVAAAKVDGMGRSANWGEFTQAAVTIMMDDCITVETV